MSTNQEKDTAAAATPVVAPENTQQDELAQARAEMEALKAELAAKDKELAAAKAKVKEKPTTATTGAPANQAPKDPNKRVKIKLFKDGNRYKEPLYVRVNNYTALIPRGVEVSVPYFVAKHIEEMTQQDVNTAALVQAFAQEYGQKAEQLA